MKPACSDSIPRNSDFIGFEWGPGIEIILKLPKYFFYVQSRLGTLILAPGIIKFKRFLQLQLTPAYKLIFNSTTQNPHSETS